MSKRAPKSFRIGQLKNVGDVCLQLARTIRAMARKTLDPVLGTRLCNALFQLRGAMETGAMAEDIERIQNQVRVLCTTIETGSTIHGTSTYPSDPPAPYRSH
jgi:hypothetical protein